LSIWFCYCTFFIKWFSNRFFTKEEIWKNIFTKASTDGNYDAIYGKVSNFSWSFEQDGTYNISLSIISLGDVIESLKINTIAIGDIPVQTAEQTQETEEDLKDADTEAEILEYSKNKDSISKLFYDAKEKLASGTANGEVTTVDDATAKNI